MFKAHTRHSSRLLLVGILVLSGTGAWLCGELVKQHADLWETGAASTGLLARLCQAGGDSGFHCAEAARSGWGEIKLPFPVVTRSLAFQARTVVVPVAFAGLAYFVFMGCWFAFGPSVAFGRWNRLPLVVGVSGSVVSWFYIGVMALGLAPLCTWCLAVHLINFCLVLAVVRLCRARIAADLDAAGQEGTVGAAREAAHAVVFALILVAGLWSYRGDRLAVQDRISRLVPYKKLVLSLQEDPDFLLREFYAQDQHDLPPRPGESRENGVPDLVVFTDYQCQACYCKHLFLRQQATEAFGDRLTMTVRHYPICETCNRNVTGAIHSEACAAAYAVEAARQLGGERMFWLMHNLLFENRKRLGEDTYRAIAVEIGLDPDELIREMAGKEVRERVASDIALARDLGVTGTPSVFLDGRRVPGPWQTRVFWHAVARSSNTPEKRTDMVSSGAPGDPLAVRHGEILP